MISTSRKKGNKLHMSINALFVLASILQISISKTYGKYNLESVNRELIIPNVFIDRGHFNDNILKLYLEHP